PQLRRAATHPWIAALETTLGLSTAVAATGLTLAVAATSVPPSPRPSNATQTLAAVAPSPRATPTGPASAPRGEAEPVPVPVPRPPTAPRIAPVEASRPTARARPRATAVSPDTLADQTERLSAARRALNEGRAAEALERLEQHARDYPTSTLAELRGALRVEVLCTLGRSTQARDEAAALVRLHPRSNVARHATTVCSTP
ncbi:MAG: hypothetical protein KDK70_36925, partial [Myxococcales bacterium]|nr:hypothetical protein [Myxococcales bacterium]